MSWFHSRSHIPHLEISRITQVSWCWSDETNSKNSRIRLLTQPYSNDRRTQWIVTLLIFKDIIVYFRFPRNGRRGTMISTTGQNSVLVFMPEFPASWSVISSTCSGTHDGISECAGLSNFPFESVIRNCRPSTDDNSCAGLLTVTISSPHRQFYCCRTHVDLSNEARHAGRCKCRT